MSIPAYGATGPVETRPHWVQDGQPQRDARERRRLAQIRRSMGEQQPSARIATGQLPVLERGYLVSEMRRIVLTSTALLGLIVVLAFVIR